MLGSRADADDVLQEAFLRWTAADRSDVQSPAAYLSSIVARLCIDYRRTIKAPKRATSVPGSPNQSSAMKSAIRHTAWKWPRPCRWRY